MFLELKSVGTGLDRSATPNSDRPANTTE